MKIDKSLTSVGGLVNSEPQPRANKGANGAPAPSGSKVELSSIAASLQEAEAAIANVPVVDASRVAEIKQAISEGRFQVDAGKVADGLIDSVRQMLASQTPKA